MNFTTLLNNPYNDDKVIDACGLFGMMDLTGRCFGSKDPIKAISNMRERGNGLGGGFAIYGLYPEHKDDYAFHIMYLNTEAKEKVERLLSQNFDVVEAEEMPTNPKANVWNPPLIWRYFLQPKKSAVKGQQDDEYVFYNVMRINTESDGAFVFSSGKNMGVFKGVGFPEDIAEYFCLDEYEGYLWVCHGRFPTNTPGWWGGAHPFSILDWVVVHNGELSSYGANRRFLEMYGYHCTMQTDTEVMVYALDLLVRRHKLPMEVAAKILAPPLWIEIDTMEPSKKEVYTALRQCYGSLLMNGPFTIIAARTGEMIGLTDRIKLRPLTAGIKGDLLFLSSEESAIRAVAPNLDKVWSPRGGELVIGRLKTIRAPEIVAPEVGRSRAI
ncbi:glutamine amidotransferase family protein [Candidatus Bathyarchaeota archaeon]|nr:glutamine amidotransferase family protein [Candidatus Bathyarchaeota archaeon]